MEQEIQRCARVIGDGEFALAVVGAAEHQADLEILAGGGTEEGALKLCAALLQPKPDNPAGRKVAVIVHSCTVGYLAPKAVPALLAALEQSGFANAACEAVIFGGRHYGEADGQFGIKLNAAIPFKLVDPVVQAPLPPPPVRVKPKPPPRPEPPWAKYAPPPTARPEPPPPPPEPQPVAEPQPAARVEPPVAPAEEAQPVMQAELAPQPAAAAEPPLGPQTHLFRTEERGRSYFGSLVLAVAVLFNAAMAVWLAAFWTGLFELADAVLVGGEWEERLRGWLGTELIVAIWIAGAVVLVAAAYATRGKTVVVEEIAETPAAPTE